jgi:hypothetical protein
MERKINSSCHSCRNAENIRFKKLIEAAPQARYGQTKSIIARASLKIYCVAIFRDAHLLHAAIRPVLRSIAAKIPVETWKIDAKPCFLTTN